VAKFENDSEDRKHRRDFNDLLVDAIDETLSEVLGHRVNQVFWYHFQAFLGINRDEMPQHLDTLFTALNTVFGVGGETIGRRIIRKLYAKGKVPLNYTDGRPLLEYIEELEQILTKDFMQS